MTSCPSSTSTLSCSRALVPKQLAGPWNKSKPLKIAMPKCYKRWTRSRTKSKIIILSFWRRTHLVRTSRRKASSSKKISRAWSDQDRETTERLLESIIQQLDFLVLVQLNHWSWLALIAPHGSVLMCNFFFPELIISHSHRRQRNIKQKKKVTNDYLLLWMQHPPKPLFSSQLYPSTSLISN